MARSYAKAYDDVWGDKRLSNNDVMVYTGLVRHSYGDTMTVKNLGIRKLAEYCRVTVNTFQSCVEHLEKYGWLEVVKADKSRSEYHLLAPEVVEKVEKPKPAEKPSPYRKKFHKTIKSAKQDTSERQKDLFRRVKTIACNLDIMDAWRDEILEWVKLKLERDPSFSDLTPKEMWEKGTSKFAHSENRF